MLNLLLISDDSKVRTLKNILQPQLKAKVDVVADFDHGLQDVFEKRPATVVIQSVISGVAGESVARHIQMLLGNDAPRFILLYESDSNTHAVEGLFEHCISLALPVEQLAEEILKALQAVFGEQWINMVVPPKANAEALAASVTASREERELADRMMDDLISDMEKPEKVVSEKSVSPVPDGGDRQWICDTADEMTALLIETPFSGDQGILPAVPAAEKSKKTVRKPRAATAATKMSSGKSEPEQVSVFPESQSLPDSIVTTNSAPESAQTESPGISSTSPASSVPPVPPVAPVAPPVATGQPSTPIASVSPADFHISGKTVPEKEPIPEELLLAFEANYRSHSRSWKKMAVAAGLVGVLGAAGWWFMLSPKPFKEQSLQKKIPASAAVSATDAAPDNVKTATASVVVPRADKVIPKPAAEPKPATGFNSALPSFVPLKGRDSSYAISKPGWERYVNSAREVRVFRANDRIKAVQIMAGRGKTLDSGFLETVLQELVGSSTHTLGPRELKQGYQGYMVQQGSVGKKAELIVYRKKQTDAIVAFVVSVN